MTLPASFPLSMSQVAAELGATLPLSMLDARVLGLAQLGGAPVSFSNLLGKTGRLDANMLVNSNGAFSIPGGAAIFGASIVGILWQSAGNPQMQISFQTALPVYRGNLLLTNNTTGASVVMNAFGGGGVDWQAVTAPSNIARHGVTDSFSLTAST